MMATLAILSWPLVAVVLFFTIRDVQKAILAVMLGGFLLLPSAFAIDPPGLPGLDRDSVTMLSIAVMLVMTGSGFGKPIPAQPLGAGLFLALFMAPLLTVMTNTDPVVLANRTLPGLSPYDFVSIAFNFLILVLPLLFGYNHFRREADHRKILWALVVAGAVYTLFILWEARMSPQLHVQLYGFRPRDFIQQIRWGGYRPHVFLRSGLWLALFMFLVLAAAIVLWRDRLSGPAESSGKKNRAWRLPGILLPYFAIIMVVCKSMGALIYAVVIGPILLLLGPRAHIRIAFGLALVAVLYPQLRGVGLVPTDQMVDAAATISEERAGSLAYRFRHEEALLERANERPLFGWGVWGRNRIYDENTGRDLSVTDGVWIIQIGSFGWVGFLAFFGLMAWPILQIWIHAGRLQPTIVTSALVLMLSVNMIELLPNSTMPPLTWLMAGAIAGYVEAGLRAAKKARRKRGLQSPLPAMSLPYPANARVLR